MKIKAIIFDMDGLLIDTEKYWPNAILGVLRRVGVRITRDECRKGTMGMKIIEAVVYWRRRFPWQGVSNQTLTDEIHKLMCDYVVREGRAMPGVMKTIRACARLGIPMAIASSSPMVLIHAVVKKLGLRPYIKIVHSAQFEKYGKPHPSVYLSTAKKLGVKPSECVAFEDSPNGVLSAKAAGMFCIAVPNPEIKHDPRFRKADLVIPSLAVLATKQLKTLLQA